MIFSNISCKDSYSSDDLAHKGVHKKSENTFFMTLSELMQHFKLKNLESDRIINKETKTQSI